MIALPWYAYILTLPEIIMLIKYISLQIRERKEKRKQSQIDTVPLVHKDLEKNMPLGLEEGQEWPEYPQPAVVNQHSDTLAAGPWLPVYLEGRRLHEFEGRFVRH